MELVMIEGWCGELLWGFDVHVSRFRGGVYETVELVTRWG